MRNDIYFLSIDLGTTAIKLGLFDKKGKLKGLSIQEYKLKIPYPGWVELDEKSYLKVFKEGVKELVERSKIFPERWSAICFSSQAQTFFPLDKDRKVLYPAITWLDSRAKKEAQEIAKVFSQEEYYKTTGTFISPLITASKLLWLKTNKPNIFKKTKKFFLLKDYFIWRFTGIEASDPTILALGGIFDIEKEKFWRDMLDFIGVREEQFAKCYKPWEVVGRVTKEAEKNFGIPQGIDVIVGTLDQSLSALGAGNFEEGILTANIGTCLSLYTTTNNRILDPEFRILSAGHAVPRKFFILPFIQTAGMVLKWFRDNFIPKLDYNELTRLAGSVPPGSDSLIMLPYLTGSSCPYPNSDARGVFFGLGLHHGMPHMVRSILEAVAYAMRENIEVLKGVGINPKKIIAIGGGSRSRLWLQIISDVLSVNIQRPEIEESALLGGAILSSFALGIKPSIACAVKDFCRIKDEIKPNATNKTVYDKFYKKYIDLYKRLFT